MDDMLMRSDTSRRAGRSLLAAISVPYAAGLLGWQLARFTPVRSWWAFELVDVFGAWFYLPLPLLAVLALLFRGRRAGAWLAAPLLLFGWEYGALFLPRRVPEQGTSLRVMTANLLVSNRNAEAVLAAVAEQQPDVLAVQELSGRMATRLAEELRDRYPHQELQPSESPFGLGIFSRYPITAGPPVAACSDVCFAQQVRLELGGRSATLINVHPYPPSIGLRRLGGLPVPRQFRNDETTRVLEAVLARVGTIDGPVVVLGDLNVGDRQPFYRLLHGRLRDAHREAGWGFGHTFPNRPFEGLPALPLVRLDYVLHDDAWIAHATWTGDLSGSDHRYVVADLVLR